MSQIYGNCVFGVNSKFNKIVLYRCSEIVFLEFSGFRIFYDICFLYQKTAYYRSSFGICLFCFLLHVYFRFSLFEIPFMLDIAILCHDNRGAITCL